MRKSAMLTAAMILSMAATPAAYVAAQDNKQNDKDLGDREDDPRKFYQFHLDGVTAAGAKADYQYCDNLSSRVTSNDDTAGYSTMTGGGLLGGIMEGVQKAVEADRMKHAALRKCMAMFGYDRYFQSKADYDAAQNAPDKLDRIATAIAGGKPGTERLLK
jgi:hypothetical protein